MRSFLDIVTHRRLFRYHTLLAALLGGVVTGVAWTWNTRAASGADAYGYVSEAELWLHGNPRIDQRFAAEAPWPLTEHTFSPLGYRPSDDGSHIVPTYSPGLPLMMAAAKALGSLALGARRGHCFVFWVVPVLAGVLVFATHGIGVLIGRPLVGLAAAWLVATSPAVLFMSMWPMSDVPAAAAWTLAVALLIAETRWTAAGAGLIACLAVLVRPNLIPLAAVLTLWIGWRDVTACRRDWHQACTPWFVFGACFGVIGVMFIYARLYGSPFRSGYGILSDKFAIRWIPRNFQHFSEWLISTETPLAVLGLLSLAFPFIHMWTDDRARRVSSLLAGCTAMVWGSYLAYVTFYEWWYLRFLLPSWPMMAIGTASLLAACYRLRTTWAQVIAVGALIGVGVHGLVTARQRGVFDLARQESVYVEAARAVEAFAGPDDVIISQQFSGSTRYYAGRLTLRYNYLEPQWLDRAVQWLAERGHHSYFLLTDTEVWRLRSEFGQGSKLARLDWTPTAVLRGGQVRLYDSVPRYMNTEPFSVPETAQAPCQPPRPNPTLRTITESK